MDERDGKRNEFKQLCAHREWPEYGEGAEEVQSVRYGERHPVKNGEQSKSPIKATFN